MNDQQQVKTIRESGKDKQQAKLTLKVKQKRDRHEN